MSDWFRGNAASLLGGLSKQYRVFAIQTRLPWGFMIHRYYDEVFEISALVCHRNILHSMKG
jgi:hypothetical protein